MKQPRRQIWTANRRKLALGILGVAAAGIFSRAIYLQVVDTEFLQGQGDERFLRTVEVPAHRGMITDRNGEPLAVSSPVDSLWVHPPTLLANQERLPELARMLGMNVADLETKVLARKDKEFMYLRRAMEPDAAARVMALGIQGVFKQREYRRYYPAAEVTAHLLGFTDIDDAGQEGIELAYNAVLQGRPGEKRVIKDRYGRTVEDVESVREPQPGQTVTLSIDRRIQYLAYRALKAAVLEYHAASAAAVVLDPTTGEVLAMVNQPSSNPNNRAEIRSDLLRNRTVTDVYEPGSTMKPFTIAMALESGKYRPDTPINTAPGTLSVGRYTVRDTHNYGLLDVFRVITKSSNVGTTKIALSLPAESLWKTFRAVGFGRPTGVGFPGEQGGWLAHFSRWSTIGHANQSFGYGISVTPLQLARAYGALASGGILRPVSLVKLDQAPAGERVFPAEVIRQLLPMMESVISAQGTAQRAAVTGYRVAGKTGTVHKIVGRGYAKNNYFAVFAGFAPASNPRLVMVVIVDDPRGKSYYGGLVAAPVFAKVMSGALRILNVPPDNVSNPKTTNVKPVVAAAPRGAR
ncbi:peptidoglycan D,D-transpeptidase FtsI family protein [Plasticicumulans acidivorans]|uniref:Peptidoglycan D,D-transpeptidase FtsI n=1 Tax=Plasticicumulans acidivorans TaxID=886464 RepID=A0A317MV12_9GAMM|nr:penicillin-binding transpeptidase domain-containing protein [Plasticicumulans acidivorans]PWV61823.1 peptidoglycan synthetase FtsI [Plasticicumulans acidivorans]